MIREAIMAVILPVYVAATMHVAAVPEPAEPEMEYVGDYRVTAFNYEEGGGENYYTASGAEPVPYYTCATTEEFPFGTLLYIEDIGIVEVQDRGAFPEGIIDLHIGETPISEFDDKVREVYIVRRQK